MRKNMQRIMSIMLVLLLLIPSLAMADTNIAIDYIQEDNNITVNIKGNRNRPVSITIKDEFRYYYINQGITDDLGKLKFDTTLDMGKTYDCQVNIDGEIARKKLVMKKTDTGTDPEEPTPGEPDSEIASLYISGYRGTILSKSNIEIKKGESVLSFTTRILDENNISYENRSGYIASIDGQGEFDKGPNSGWTYSVNGRSPNMGAGSVRVKAGDSIGWTYTYDIDSSMGWEDIPEAEIVKKALGIINNKKSTEKEIEESINNVTKYFANKSQNIKGEEIHSVLKDANETSKVFATALENAKTEQLAVKIAESSLEITNSLGSIIDNSTDLKIIENISEISRENVGIALLSTEKISNKGKVDKIVDNIIETSTKIEEKYSKKTANPNKIVEKTVAIKAGEKEEKAGNFTLPNTLIGKANVKKLDKIKLITRQATIEFSPEFLGEKVKDDVITNINSHKDVLSLGFKLGDKEQAQFQKPIKVILPYDKEVANKDRITVNLVREDGTREAVGGIYDPATKTIKFITNKPGKFIVEEGRREFKDTSSHKWAEEAIESMAVKGIIEGKSEDKFDPAANITRAEFGALVSRMLKLNEDTNKDIPFKDVPNNKWYYNSVAAIYENGLINGRTNTSFDPEGNITREEMAKIIGNILESNSYKKQDKKELAKFKDKNSIAPWAEETASIAVYNGVIDGSNGKFMPKQNATRAEAAMMLYRLYELIMN